MGDVRLERIDFSKSFAKSVLLSGTAQALVDRKAEQICAAANGMAGFNAYKATSGNRSTGRCHAFVSTVHYKRDGTENKGVMAFEAKHQYLLKAKG